MKKQKGITLVALVVTIIILLILAGISIASLTGNGLFEKAKLAKEKQENAEKLENTVLTGYENEIDSYLSNSNRQNSISSVHPRGTAVILDSGNFSTKKTYIAPDDGWVNLSTLASGTGPKWYYIKIGELIESGGATEYQNYRVALPCLKGQEIQYQVWGTNVSGELKFIPMK